MRKTIKKFIPLLELLCNLEAKQRKTYLKTAKPDLLKFLSDIVHNFHSGVLKVSDEIVEKLRPYRNSIKKLTQKKLSLTGRKKILLSPQFFPKVIAILTPELIKLVNND